MAFPHDRGTHARSLLEKKENQHRMRNDFPMGETAAFQPPSLLSECERTSKTPKSLKKTICSMRGSSLHSLCTYQISTGFLIDGLAFSF